MKYVHPWSPSFLCAFRFVFCDRSIVLAHVYRCGSGIKPITITSLASSLAAVWTRNAGDTGIVPSSQLPQPLSNGVCTAGPSDESCRFPAGKCPAGPPASDRSNPRHDHVDSTDISRTFGGILWWFAIVTWGIGRHLGAEQFMLPVPNRQCTTGPRSKHAVKSRHRRNAKPTDGIVFGRMCAQVAVCAAASGTPCDAISAGCRQSLSCGSYGQRKPSYTGTSAVQFTPAHPSHRVLCSRAGRTVSRRSQRLPDATTAGPVGPVWPLLRLVCQPTDWSLHLCHLQQCPVLPRVHHRICQQVQISRSCLMILQLLTNLPLGMAFLSVFS